MKKNIKKTSCKFSQVVNQGYLGAGIRPAPFIMLMEDKNKVKRIPLGAGYGLGLVFGISIMIVFAVVLGAAFFGITLGLSFSLSIGIAFECAFAGEKRLPLFQKIMLSLSALLLLLAVVSLLLWNGL
jgi:hypothetical protein